MWLIDSGVSLSTDLGDRRQPDLLRRLSGDRRRHVDAVERRQSALEFRLHLEHDAVLIRLREDRRHQALAERVVQRVVDRGGCDAQSAGRRPVELDVSLQPAILVIAGHVGQLRHLLQPLEDLGNPLGQVRRIHGLEGELVLRAADAVLDRQVLHRLHVERNALHPGKLRLQAPDDVACAGAAHAPGFQVDEHPSAVERGIRPVDADERRQARDGRILENDGRKRLLPLGHRREGDRLRRFGDALDGTRVLDGEETLGDHDVQDDRQHEGNDCDDQRGALPVQHPVQHLLRSAR